MTLPEGLFARIKRIISGGQDDKKLFLTLCKENFQLELKEEEVMVKDGVARITASSALKNRIFMIKSALLEALRQNQSPIHTIQF